MRGLQLDCNDTTIVSAVIGLAKSLGLATVAEGVETPEQLSILRSLGCDYSQGFYFCRPAPADTVASLLPRHNPGDCERSGCRTGARGQSAEARAACQ